MRNRFLTTVGLLASAAACAAPAAADNLLSVRQPPAAQPAPATPPYVPGWTGFHLGIHGGGAWDHASIDSPLLDSLGMRVPDAKARGSIVGGQAGYNWQYGPVVGGVEVDFSGADIATSSIITLGGAPVTRNLKTDQLASARGRLGYLLWSNWLVYGTAGIGWSHTRIERNFNAVSTSTNFLDEFGWVAGAGLEYKLFEHLLLRAEYLHYDFGENTYSVQSPVITPIINTNIAQRVDVFRGGISYKF
jgi:outer membrane immunogenic protein